VADSAGGSGQKSRDKILDSRGGERFSVFVFTDVVIGCCVRFGDRRRAIQRLGEGFCGYRL
jgi:hypothetical protein